MRDNAWCDRYAVSDGASVESMYDWAPDFLVEAFNNAERAVCSGNALGCVTSERDVEIAIVSDGVANAMIQGDRSQLRVIVTTGLLDFADAAEMSYVDELRARLSGRGPIGGLTDWLQNMRSLAGKPCVFHSPSPLHQVSQAQFVEVRTAAQAFYEFVMGHELAHARSPGANCWASTSPSDVSREVSCDRASFLSLALPPSGAQSRAFPPMIVPPLVAMAQYERILNGRLGRLVAPASGGTLLEAAPTRNWLDRAQRLVDLWESHCRQHGLDQITCRDGWAGAVSEARRLLGLPAPGSCVDNNSTSAELVNAGRSPGAAAGAPAPGTFCAGVLDLLSGATGGFVATRGTHKDNVDGDSVWDSRVTVSGTRQCRIWRYGDGSDAARCSIDKDNDEAAVRSKYLSVSQDLRNCLSSWTFSELRSGTAVITTKLEAQSSSTAHTVKLHMSHVVSGNSELTLIVQ
jgi:hypothetical protein